MNFSISTPLNSSGEGKERRKKGGRKEEGRKTRLCESGRRKRKKTAKDLPNHPHRMRKKRKRGRNEFARIPGRILL